MAHCIRAYHLKDGYAARRSLRIIKKVSHAETYRINYTIIVNGGNSQVGARPGTTCGRYYQRSLTRT